MIVKLKRISYALLGIIIPILSFFISVLSFLQQCDLTPVKHPNWQGLFIWLNNIDLTIWILVLSLLLAILAVIKFYVDNRLSEIYKKQAELLEKLETISENTNNLINGFLLSISKKLEFQEGDKSRLSLYIHDGSNQFVRCGRYSPDPKLNIPGRPSYPDNEGCIGDGWRDGWCYNNNGVSFKMPKFKYTKLAMKSNLIIVMRIDTIDSKPMALLVLECIDARRFDEDFAKNKLLPLKDEIATIISNLKDFIPIPSYASERGL